MPSARDLQNFIAATLAHPDPVRVFGPQTIIVEGAGRALVILPSSFAGGAWIAYKAEPHDVLDPKRFSYSGFEYDRFESLREAAEFADRFASEVRREVAAAGIRRAVARAVEVARKHGRKFSLLNALPNF